MTPNYLYHLTDWCARVGLRPCRTLCDFARRASLVLSLGVLFLFAPYLASTASSQQRSLSVDSTEKVDAVLLLDTSGSMLLNDPRRLRDEGARLFIQFLKPGDNLAIIEFSETASIVRPLIPYEASQAEEVGKVISGLKTEGQYTDLLLALERAREVLDASGRPDAKPVVILLSDGKMEPSPSRGSAPVLTQRLLEEVLPDLRRLSRRVYALAFSADADKELLQQIAAATDAIHWFTPSADDLHRSFADLFLAVKKPQVIPLGAKGFTIDENVTEATFYINRAQEREVQIQHPNGQLFTSTSFPSNVRWFTSERFEVITIENPEVGTWSASGVTRDDGFATILTNLRLISDWPNVLEAGRGEVLQARLYESDKPVALPEMTGLIKYAYQITPTDRVAEPIARGFLADAGEAGDTIAHDGIFAQTILIEEPGDYELRLIAKAPTFERQLQIPFRVKPPIVSVVAVAGAAEPGVAVVGETGEGPAAGDVLSEDKDGLITGDQYAQFQIELNDDARTLKDLQVQLTATDDQRRLIKIPVEPAGTSVGSYRASAALLPSDGQFEIRVSVSGEDRGRSSVRESGRPLLFRRVSSEATPRVVEVVATEEAPPAEEGFSFVALILMIVLIGAAGGGALFLAKGSGGGQPVQSKTSPVAEALLARVKELEARKAVTEVDLTSADFDENPVGAA